MKKKLILLTLLIFAIGCGRTTGSQPSASNLQHQASPPHSTLKQMATTIHQPTPTKQPTCTVSANALNVRTGPNVEYPIAFRLKKGEQPEIISGHAEHWLQIKSGDKVGYINSTYCE